MLPRGSSAFFRSKAGRVLYGKNLTPLIFADRAHLWEAKQEYAVGSTARDLWLATEELTGVLRNGSVFRSLILIGRSATLTENDRRKLNTLQGQIPRLRILTYDELVQSAKAMAENLFGPLDITGQNVEIYYFPPDAGAATADRK